MKLTGKCKVLRIFLDENLKLKNQLLYRAIVRKLLDLKMAGATVFKAVEGFGSHAHLHDSGVLELSENLPMVIEAVDRPAQIRKALREIEPMLPTHCLVTIQDIQVLHYHLPEGKHKPAKNS
jgi:uncharacterized protein